MKSSDGKPFVYEKNQLIEVICQLRFPTILSIDSREPADFQELIRGNFPRYSVQTERGAAPGGEAGSGKNYSFISADGKYKLSLTKSFIALSTVAYTNWQEFAGWLDEPLGHFISVYRPAYFERVGLRYLNAISREKLELTDCRWRELIAPEYLGVLALERTDETGVLKSQMDTEMKLGGGSAVKLHAGPGMIRRGVRTEKGFRQIQDNEVRFILDMDVYSAGEIKIQSAAEVLDTLHSHADELFSSAISDKLHDAMEPTYIV